MDYEKPAPLTLQDYVDEAKPSKDSTHVKNTIEEEKEAPEILLVIDDSEFLDSSKLHS